MFFLVYFAFGLWCILCALLAHFGLDFGALIFCDPLVLLELLVLLSGGSDCDCD